MVNATVLVEASPEIAATLLPVLFVMGTVLEETLVHAINAQAVEVGLRICNCVHDSGGPVAGAEATVAERRERGSREVF